MSKSSICYLEIPAPDIKKASTFYASVFDWNVRESDLSDVAYSMFDTGEEGALCGGLDSSKPVQKGGIIFYIKVGNMDAVLAAIKNEGGSVVTGKEDIGGGYGFSAVFEDPNGNHVGLWSDK